MKIVIIRKYKKGLYTIGELYMDGQFICNTLEPVDRGLVYDGKDYDTMKRSVELMKARFPKGSTAIPCGQYRVKMQISSKFGAKRPFLVNVPGFAGIMIHEGNTRKNTSGCILVGANTLKAHVMDSRKYLGVITSAIRDAEDRGEVVMISVR